MTWQSARPETERNTKLVNPLENFLMESCNVKTEANTSVIYIDIFPKENLFNPGLLYLTIISLLLQPNAHLTCDSGVILKK